MIHDISIGEPWMWAAFIAFSAKMLIGASVVASLMATRNKPSH